MPQRIGIIKMSRIHWKKNDKLELDKAFEENPHPDLQAREKLADKFRVTVNKVTNFFKNKRQNLRRNGKSIKRVFQNTNKSNKLDKTKEKPDKTGQPETNQPIIPEEIEIVLSEKTGGKPTNNIRRD